MSFLSRLFGRGSESGRGGSGGPKFLRKEQKGGSTYEVYKGSDAKSAKAFLATIRVDKPRHYVIVETSEGNWGIDVKGIFLERLLPWQRDVGAAQCSGHLARMPDMFGVQMAAKGINDNFVSTVKCGKCEHERIDAVRYQQTTVVRCPECRVLNGVDTSNITCVFV